MVTINIKKGHLICFGVLFFLFGILTFINSAPNFAYHLLSEVGVLDGNGNFVSVDANGDGIVDRARNVDSVSWDQIAGKPESISDGLKYCKCNKPGSTLTGICDTGCAASSGDVTKVEYYMDIGDDGKYASDPTHSQPNPVCPAGTRATPVFEQLSNCWDSYTVRQCVDENDGGCIRYGDVTNYRCGYRDNAEQRLVNLRAAMKEKGFSNADIAIMASNKLSHSDYHDSNGCNSVRVIKCETVAPDYYYNIPL